MKSQVTKAVEHSCIDEAYQSTAASLLTDIPYYESNKYYHLYLCWNGGKINTGYFIGLTWLHRRDALQSVAPNDRVALGVTPKVDNLNYWKMFMEALGDVSTFAHLQEQTNNYRMVFGIDLEAPEIACSDVRLDPLPLLYYQFLATVRHLVHQGLRKGYQTVQSTLQARTQGKVLVTDTLRFRQRYHRQDQTRCQYHIHTVDTNENRYLKAALMAVLALTPKAFADGREESNILTKLAQANLSAFEHVAETYPRVRPTVCPGGFYRHYQAALSLGEMILKRQSLQQNQSERKLPPFYINMPLLFEIWVFQQLNKKEPGRYEFQNKIDFVVPDILYYGKSNSSDTERREDICIIDCKYKYSRNGSIALEDAGQLSAYARNPEIRQVLFKGKPGDKRILEDDRHIHCQIIYHATSSENQQAVFPNNYVGFSTKYWLLPLLGAP